MVALGGGVVGDFQGDAAMGFGGWPLAQPDAVARTCRAALGIRAEFVAAATDNGIYRSTDAGLTWASIGVVTGSPLRGGGGWPQPRR